MWLLVACQTDDGPTTAETGTEVPSWSPVLSIGEATAGQPVELTLTGGPPDTAVTVFLSTEDDLETADCLSFAPLCLDLLAPTVLPDALITDGSGEGMVSVILPEIDLQWLQAGFVDRGWAFVTPVVEVDPFEPPPVVTVTLEAREGIHDLWALTEVTTFDPDTLTLTYEWSVDGQALPLQRTERIYATDVFPGQSWCVEVTPDDVYGTGVPAAACVTIPEPAGTNVIFILLDDVGADKFGFMNPASETVDTPNIDSLVDQGMVFDNAYAAPMCSTARAALLSGRFARRNGLGNVLQGAEMYPLESELLPEALVQARTTASWSTAALGKWNLSGVENNFDMPALQGFGHFAGMLTTMTDEPPSPNSYFDWPKVVNGWDIGRQTVYNTTDIIDDAIEQVNTLPEPFFLYIALNAAHDPLEAPPDELYDYLLPDPPTVADLHRAVLQAADTEIGRFLDAIPAALLPTTTIFLSSDNGTQPEAVEFPYSPDRAKRTVFEGGVHVPFVAAGAHVAQPGSRSAALVQFVDLYITMAELAGSPLVDMASGNYGLPVDGKLRELDGRSLLPFLADPNAPSARDYVFTEIFDPNGPPPYENDMSSVRNATHKLVRSNGEEALFELTPGELDEGPNILFDGIDSTEQAMLDELVAQLDLYTTLPYDGF
jgi:arylsulfatase A-like enzyme